MCVHLPVLAPHFVASFPPFFSIYFYFLLTSVSNISACVDDTLRSPVLPACCCLVVPVPLRYRSASCQYTFLPSVSDLCGHIAPLSVLRVCVLLRVLSVCPFRDPFCCLWSVNKVSQSYVGQVCNFHRVSVSSQHGRFRFRSLFVFFFFLAKGVPMSSFIQTLHPHPSHWNLYKVQADPVIPVCHIRVALKVVFHQSYSHSSSALLLGVL